VTTTTMLRGGAWKKMKTLIILLLWTIVLVLCWPIAVLVLLLWPVVWLLSIPFRVVTAAMGAVLALVREILFLPARLLGYRGRA
jgi:uncharacterized membrane protein YoaK (UPF0700 family)